MSESNIVLRLGIAASVAIHLAAVLAGLGYAGFLLVPSGPEQSIAVDLVTPQEAAELTKPPEPQAQPPQQDPSAQLPESAPQPTDKPQQEAPEISVSSAPDAPIQQPESPNQSTPQAQAVIKQPEPDISVRYPMNPSLFGSLPGDFDAKADSAAQIDRNTAAAFRAQLKTCSTLPKEVGQDDKVVIVIRAQFRPDGRLATTPILIEASASAKGPLLMQAAIAALKACQPYVTLPADKYQEWKMLDLSFTPQDFQKG